MEPKFHSKSPALEFTVLATYGKARAAHMILPHGPVETPIFMPVGTQGTIKGLTCEQLESLSPPIILGNTYHLGHRPGSDVIEIMGGLHKFMSWNKNILTDSGGFQMVSLLKLAEITEEGVKFESPHDGSELLLTPEKSIEIQNTIGADIIMALDDVVSSTVTGSRVEEAMYRTIRWIDRCIKSHKRPNDQNLFGIIQGGLYPNLRNICLEEFSKRDLPGYAIGGLSGGESKDQFWKIVSQCTDKLPQNKPRYLMGVGFPVDLVVCIALGVDMFDCVYPTRTARFGTALVSTGVMNLKHKMYAKDFKPVEETCDCYTCKNYTRAFLHTKSKGETLCGILLSYHNIAYQLRLMSQARESIINGRFTEFVQQFMVKQFPKRDYPSWVVEALCSVGIELLN